MIALRGVDDRYPPQKKSFMMLHYMYEHYIDKFEWFMRADDDVYMRTDRMEKFLRSIDSSKPQFIGKKILKIFFLFVYNFIFIFIYMLHGKTYLNFMYMFNFLLISGC